MSLEFSKFLIEMLVHDLGQGKKDPSPMFVAWRQHLWVGSYQDIENHTQEIYQTIIREHPRGQEIGNNQYRQNPEDIIGWMRDYIHDGITGYYDPKTKRISIYGDQASPVSSPLAAKVAQELGARRFDQEYSDERTASYKRSRLTGQIPSIVYHGTSAKYLGGIFRYGLMPKPEQSNYRAAAHQDKVFVTSSKPEAEMHAFHTARGGDQAIGSRLNRRTYSQQSYPLVLALSLPDPAKIVPDMDVDRKASGTNYDHSYHYDNNDEPDAYYSVDSMKASKHAGTFGYAGRIPSKFITQYLVYSYYAKKWLNVPVEKIPILLDRVANQGDDYWSHMLGYPEDQ